MFVDVTAAPAVVALPDDLPGIINIAIIVERHAWLGPFDHDPGIIHTIQISGRAGRGARKRRRVGEIAPPRGSL